MQLEKEKAGGVGSRNGNLLGVSRGRLKGVMVEDEGKGGYTGTSTSLLKRRGLGVTTPSDHYR